MKSLSIIPSFLVLLGLSVSGLALVPNHSSVEFGDRTFTAVGHASLANLPNGALSAVLGAPDASIAIKTGLAPALNVYFEPVEISVGDAWTATAVNVDGRRIASVRHAQTGPTTTDVFLNLGENASEIAGEVRLFTHLEGELTHEASLLPAEEIFLGTVTASSAAWGKTYHLYCTNGSCSLGTDPDETSLKFAADGVSARFQYVSVSFAFADKSLAAASTLEFSGTGVSNMTFTGHDAIPLSIYQ